MKNIKFGLKLWSINKDLVKEAEQLVKDKVFDYIELTTVPGINLDPFVELDVNYIVHAPTYKHGVNIADATKESENLNKLNECIKKANKLDAKYIIVHPGFGEIDIAKKLLQKIDDERIIIENMPKVGVSGEKMIGYNIEQIKELQQNKFGFCLDLNHAIKAAVSLDKDYKEFLKEFIKLKPDVVHISDGNLDKEKDEHLNIGEGDYDFIFLSNIIKNNNTNYLTLETPRENLDSLQQDVANLRKLKAYLSI